MSFKIYTEKLGLDICLSLNVFMIRTYLFYGQLGPLQTQPILKSARIKVGPLQSEYVNNSLIFIFMYKI